MAKDVSVEIAKLEEKLEKLRAAQLDSLREKLTAARKVASDLESQIAAIARKPASTRRTRTNPAEVRKRIIAAVSKSPKGLTQKEISDQSSLPYGSVVQFLKRNEKEFKTDGKGKQKRYFLK